MRIKRDVGFRTVSVMVVGLAVGATMSRIECVSVVRLVVLIYFTDASPRDRMKNNQVGMI
jgi:hypothetical protein